MNNSYEKKIIVFAFLAVPITLLIIFKYYAAARLFQYSFTDWNGIDKKMNYIGFANYAEIFTNPDNIKVFAHNLAYIISGIVQNIIALLLAVVLTGKTKGRNFFRSVLFMPYLMNSVAVSYMFSFMYDYSNGALNTFLSAFGIKGVRWLSNPAIVNFSLAFIELWKCVGYSMVIFIGGLQSVDSQVYEAADIDGANAWQRLIHITLPCIKKIVQLNLFLSVTGSIKAFNEAFTITNGGPGGASMTYVMKTVLTAFTYNNFGLASAMGIVLMIFLAVITVIQNKVVGADE